MKKERGSASKGRQGRASGKPMRGSERALLPVLELIRASARTVDGLVAELGMAGLRAALELSEAGRLPGAGRGSGRKGPGRDGSSEAERLRRQILETAGVEAAGGGGRGGSAVREAGRVQAEGAEGGGRLRELGERRFEEADLLVLYIAGARLRRQPLICALGVDAQGRRHVLGVRAGSAESAACAGEFLRGLAGRGVEAGRRRLFVIEGSQALRAGVERVFGPGNLVQLCRWREQERVCGLLPAGLDKEVRSEMREASRLPAGRGEALLRKRAEWLELRHPGAAASLMRGLRESFTVERLPLSPALRECLGSTHILQSLFTGLRAGQGRLEPGPAAALAAELLAEAEKGFLRLKGWRDLWMLQGCLGEALRPGAGPEGGPRHCRPQSVESGAEGEPPVEGRPQRGGTR